MTTTVSKTAFGTPVVAATILENPTYYPEYRGGSDALFIKVKLANGTVARAAMRRGVVEAFLTKSDGVAAVRDDGTYDFRGLELVVRGTTAQAKSNGQIFLNVGYVLDVRVAKAKPAAQAIAEPAAQALAEPANKF